MPDFTNIQNEFLSKAIAVIEENMSDENFGVAEMAEQLNMSRSNLLRKIKKATDVSASVLIRQVRLHRAKELLKDNSLTASEVSYQVGFNSTSYFTKCFREQYGYTPGEESKKSIEQNTDVIENAEESPKKRSPMLTILAIGFVVVGGLLMLLSKREVGPKKILDKSIAVLPFKNDSNDSTNVYIINGLMEAVLDNLQKVEDLKVTSRTTVEKYREVLKTIPELSEELNVSYFVEGSGQKIGDKILLTVQLIEAPSDKHIWSERYERQTKDIFQLQAEVAKSIADQIEAVITPEEAERIEKIPTQNLEAYDYYLQGLDLTKSEKRVDLFKAIEFFQKAIAGDEEFVLPYAYIAICYYYIDLFQNNKQYGNEINTYADKALLLDSDLGQSLIAKALFYMHDKQYELAIKYFEKVLELNPNSGWTHNFLSDIYTIYRPNSTKYLRHAIQGIQLEVAGQDSLTASNTYLHLSNALAQTGFIREAEKYAEKSLAYNNQNLFSETLYAYIKLAQNSDLRATKILLESTLKKDTSRFDIVQEIAKLCYVMEDYEAAWFYYKKFLHITTVFDVDVYQGEDIKIAFVLNKLGRTEEAKKYLESYLAFAQNDESAYKDLIMAGYHAVLGNTDKGIEHFKAFSNQEEYQYWFVLFLEQDPIMQQLSGHPDFKKIIDKINDKFWDRHKEIKKTLKEQGVI